MHIAHHPLLGAVVHRLMARVVVPNAHVGIQFIGVDGLRFVADDEVMQEGLTRNIGHFSRFLEAASLSQGQTINISGVARDAQVTRPVAENYFSILEDLLIAVRLPVFSRRAKRKLIAQPKYYFLDSGVFRAIRPMGPLDSEAELAGPRSKP